jgi:hypothetical protein
MSSCIKQSCGVLQKIKGALRVCCWYATQVHFVINHRLKEAKNAGIYMLNEAQTWMAL